MLRDNSHVMLSVLQIGSSWVRYLMSEALWSHGTWYLVDCLNAESCKECCGGSTDSRENRRGHGDGGIPSLRGLRGREEGGRVGPVVVVTSF